MAGVVLVLGDEPLLLREAAEQVVRRRPDLDVERFHGPDCTLGAILDEVRTPSLLGGGRAVVLGDAQAVLDDRGLDAVADYAERPNPAALLVMVCSGLDGRKKGVKRLKAAAQVVECGAPPVWEMPRWVARRASEHHGLEIAPPVAEELVSRLGEDLGTLDGALARLKEQIAPRTRLDRADVVESTEEQRSPILFEAASAVEERDAARAFDALAAAFDEGIRLRREIVTDPGGIAPILLSSLHGAWSKLLRFHLLQRQGVAEEEAARSVGVSGKAMRFFLPRARRHRLERLLEGHRAFLDCDLTLKRSGATPRQALERLVLTLLR
jgi:DNA polymerase III delta subunit